MLWSTRKGKSGEATVRGMDGERALRKLISKGRRLHVVYEAGTCGFVIRRHLTALPAQARPDAQRRGQPALGIGPSAVIVR